MPERIHRREFLKTAGPAALVGPELARGAHSWTSTSTATSEPGTNANPRLLTGCCAYSYSKLLKAGKMTMEDVIRKAVELGVAAVDMTAYWFKSTEPAYSFLAASGIQRRSLFLRRGHRNQHCASRR